MEKERMLSISKEEALPKDLIETKEEDELMDERDMEIIRLMQENEALRRKETERILEEDLQKVRSLDPKIGKIEDLGELFIALRANGISCKEAYRAVAAINDKKEIPQMGDVLSFKEERDFFTPDEVKSMTKEEIKKNYDRIRKSMSKWKA